MESFAVIVFYLGVFLNLTQSGFAQPQFLLRQNGEAFNSNVNYGGFQYQVNDIATGSKHSHVQSNIGNGVNGQYQVVLPDGRLQIVTYVADGLGYRANVDYKPSVDASSLNRAAVIGQFPLYQGLSRSSIIYPAYANSFQRSPSLNFLPFRSSDAGVTVDNPLLTPETNTVPEAVSAVNPVAANSIPYTPLSCLQYNPITYICWVQFNMMNGFGPIPLNPIHGLGPLGQLRSVSSSGINGYSYTTPHSQVSMFQSG